MLKVQLIWFDLYAVLWEQECRSQQVRHVAIMEIVRNDHLGSVTRIIRSNGAQVFLLRYAPQASPDVAERSAQYDPWGVQTVTTNTIGFSRGYCGHEMLNGDLVISLDTVRTNAELFHKTYEEELYRVIIHGVLHLCGINDKGPGERELMEAAENKALKTLPLPSL